MPKPRLSLSGVGEGVCAETIVAVEMIRIARVSESAVKTGNAFHPFFVVFFMAYFRSTLTSCGGPMRSVPRRGRSCELIDLHMHFDHRNHQVTGRKSIVGQIRAKLFCRFSLSSFFSQFR